MEGPRAKTERSPKKARGRKIEHMIGLVAVLDIESREFALEPWIKGETPERHLVKISMHPTTHELQTRHYIILGYAKADHLPIGKTSDMDPRLGRWIEDMEELSKKIIVQPTIEEQQREMRKRGIKT